MSERTAKAWWRRWSAVVLLFVVLLPAAGRGDGLDADRLAWSTLSFRAKKLVFSLESDLSVEVVPSPVGAPAKAVRLTLDARGMGRGALTRLWVEPASARALERTQLRSGGRRRYKWMRFTDQGVEVVARRPMAGDDPASPESWSGRRERFEAFPDWLDDGIEVTEPTALFYVLATAPLEEVGDRIEVPILSDDELILVDAVVRGIEEIDVDYVHVSAAGERRVSGRAPALRIELDGRRLDPGSPTANLEFMGMKGSIEIFLDPTTRAPLRVSGRVPIAGRAHAHIRRLEARTEPLGLRSPR